MTDNKLFMIKAQAVLRGKWSKVIVAGLIGTFVTGWLPIIGESKTYLGILALVLGGPVTIGICLFILKIVRGEEPDLNHIASFFCNIEKFTAAFVACLLVSVFVFLCTLLLIVPGIWAALGYTMVYYIVADDPAIGSLEAMEKSREMMFGHKWQMFCLWLRFIGWFLLGILTGGILLLWVSPYFTTAVALFYEELKNDSTGLTASDI